MIRFVDIRGADTGTRFAFWSTVTDQFLTIDGVQSWNDSQDLIECMDSDCDYDDDERDRQRLLTKLPAWANLPVPEEQEALDLIAEAIPRAAELLVNGKLANNCSWDHHDCDRAGLYFDMKVQIDRGIVDPKQGPNEYQLELMALAGAQLAIHMDHLLSKSDPIPTRSDMHINAALSTVAAAWDKEEP